MPEFFGRPQPSTMTDDFGIDVGIERAEHADVNGILDRESQLPVLHAPRWTDAPNARLARTYPSCFPFPFLLVVGYAIARAST
jgi:hypothetical protein